MTAPLSGLRVADFSKFLPGPYCTWLLADLGAEVIRIENPRELAKQEKVFGWDKLPNEERENVRAREAFSRGKKSVLLDPGGAEERDALHALVKTADILVEDYRPGVMEAMGYGYAAMAALNPQLIYCSVTLCGQTGPYARKPGHDPIALAIAGVLGRVGEDPKQPSFPGVPVADLLTGSNAVIGILAALMARATSQRGQHVDIAMSDSAMALIGTVLSRNSDLSRVPPRGTRRADCGIWPTSDGGHIVTTDMEPAYWRRFCEAVGRPDFADRQMDRAGWPAMRAELATIISLRSRTEWLDILGAADTQFAPVYGIREALDDPHNIVRGMALELKGAGGVTMPHLGSPIHLSDMSPVTPTPAGRPGADTEALLAELGFHSRQQTRFEENDLG
jgi:crotonobetainyl-CoA:carnitine CoA-transferase CaiB-like acyl-CoA transferase